jgi:hypothetical protein
MGSMYDYISLNPSVAVMRIIKDYALIILLVQLSIYVYNLHSYNFGLC